MTQGKFTRKEISFLANGCTWRGWLYQPQEPGPRPAIVMTHGYACVKELFMDKFAAVFAEHGFVVLAYDHRNFGESDGDVRQEIDPVAQLNDMRDAISFLQTLPEVDPVRIGVWGSSLAGGHALVIGALDKRVRCIVAQIPTINARRNLERRVPIDALEKLMKKIDEDRLLRYQGRPPMTAPILSAELLASPYVDPRNDYRSLFWADVNEADDAWRFKNFKNEITLRSLENYAEYVPENYLSLISPTPVMMVIGDHDTVTMTVDELRAYEELTEPKELVMISGGHFTPYKEEFEKASRAACRWFQQWL